MASSPSLDDDQDLELTLKQLVGECAVALRLEEHYKVSSLCLKISRILVDLYDSEILGKNQDDEDDLDSDELEDDLEGNRGLLDSSAFIGSRGWSRVEETCQQLRRLSRHAEIYGDVLEFVRVRDLVCLGRLVGANKFDARTTTEDNKTIDIDTLSRVVRQCAVLLKDLNGNSKDTREGHWLAKDKITSIKNGVSFSRQLIDLSGGLIEISSELDHRRVAQDSLPSSALELLMSSKWFREFEGQLFDNLQLVDRFSVLVALWVVASECDHRSLEQVVAELVDQIHHQEVNSCHLDELMQLTQVGSFWLSYKKRYLVTMKRHSHYRGLDSSLLDDSELPDDRVDLEQGLAEATGKFCEPNFKLILRNIIDSELLIGRRCILCDREPSGDPLEPVQFCECPKCSLRYWPLSGGLSASQMFCSLSFQPVNWISLANLLEAKAKFTSTGQQQELLVVGPHELAQRELSTARQVDGKLFLAKSKQADGQEDEDSTSQMLGERVDISERFERLTVLRHNSANLNSNEEEEEEEDEDGSRAESPSSSNEFANFSQDGESGNLNEREEELTSSAAGFRDRQQQDELLASFLSNRLKLLLQYAKHKQAASSHLGGAPAPAWIQLSETLQLVQYSFRHDSATDSDSNLYSNLNRAVATSGTSRRPLPVNSKSTATAQRKQMVAYSGDLLALDRLGNFVDLWLVAKKPQSLGGCRASSLTSETPLERNDFEHSQNHDDEEDKLASANNSGHYLADGLGLGSQPIYSCRWRSLTSQLQVGCGRLFNPLELARLGGANGPSVRLSKYKHLDGDSKHQTLPDSPRDEDQASGAACPACRCPLALLRPGGESLLLIEKN